MLAHAQKPTVVPNNPIPRSESEDHRIEAGIGPPAIPPQLLCERYVLSDAQLSETFDMLDVDADGKLSRIEIAALLRTVNVEPTRIELDFIFQEMDSDKTGKICKEEFVRYMKCPPVSRTTLKELEQLFREYDADGDGSITFDELKKILAESAELKDTNAVKQMFTATDLDGDGRISFAEFVKMMQE